MALGKVDYGLFGVVGCLTVFIAFLNGILASAVGRYYAYSVGESRNNPVEGLRKCREWFTAAVSIHSVVPLVLMVVGYPIGQWAVENWLTIPVHRVGECVWIFRMTCVTCFMGMVSVPFVAMYNAKQYIAELTIYTFATTTLNVVALYYIASHPGDWFLKYGIWSFALTILPQIIIATRACFIFPECRLIRSCLFSRWHIKRLCNFAGWNLFGALGNLVKGQGMAILVNKSYGPAENASVTIANSLSAHADSLSSSLVWSMAPAITNACGERNMALVASLMHRTCKFGALLTVIFAVPLLLEVDEVMYLWLKNPPPAAAALFVCIIITTILEKMTTGHWISVAANGKIALYQMSVGTVTMCSILVAWAFMHFGHGVISVGYALVIDRLIVGTIRIVAVQLIVGIHCQYWLWRILLPIAVTCAAGLVAGWVPTSLMQQSFLRVCATTICVEAILVPLAWFYVLDKSERNFLAMKMSMKFKKWHDR